MRSVLTLLFTVGAGLALSSQIAMAQSIPKSKAVRLVDGEYFLSSQEDAECGCVKKGVKWLPAAINTTRNNYKLHNTEIKRWQIVARVSKKPKQKTRARQQRQKLVAERRICLPICQGGPPIVAPNPTPTPTPGAPVGCYDEFRDTTCFGIPAPLVGNEYRGLDHWNNSPGCVGCHTFQDRANRTFQQVKTAFDTVPEMAPFVSECDDQCIADVVAYLNIYNLNQ